MFYALTISKNNIITGRHMSQKPFTPDRFEKNPDLRMDEVKVVESLGEYVSGINLNCFNEDGTMRPIEQCVAEGYLPIPDGMELIEGVLVKKSVPVTEVPESLATIITQMQEEIAFLKSQLPSQDKGGKKGETL